MLSFFIAALPALFMWEFAAIKVNMRLSKPLRKRLFKTGARFALIAFIIELLEQIIPFSGYPPRTHAFLAALFAAAIPEEAVKFAGVYRFGRRELEEIGPGIAILLAVGISLGFAVLENKLYVLTGGLGAWILRALTAVPMHAIFGLVMGSFMAIAWRDHRRTNYLALALAFVTPVLFHFAYDFLVMASALNPALAWPVKALPALMIAEAGFALLLTRYALSDEIAIYGRRIQADPTGRRAGVAAFFMILLVAGIIFLNFKFRAATNLPVLAALPLVLAVDLCVTALARLSPSSR